MADGILEFHYSDRGWLGHRLAFSLMAERPEISGFSLAEELYVWSNWAMPQFGHAALDRPNQQGDIRLFLQILLSLTDFFV